jgi:polysaccharide biosynthesis/export protein
MKSCTCVIRRVRFVAPVESLRRLAFLLFSLSFVVACAGCGSTGPFVWAKDLPRDEADSATYVIVPGDVVSVRVYNQDALTTKVKVRSDGRISMPFLSDVNVQGKAPAVVAKEIEGGLKSFINTPNVTVTVDEFQPTTVSVLGEVTHPGTITIERNAGVLQALATAGGLTENASKDGIYVLRESPVPRRIRFTYESLTRAPPVGAFRLRSGDVVVVE